MDMCVVDLDKQGQDLVRMASRCGPHPLMLGQDLVRMASRCGPHPLMLGQNLVKMASRCGPHPLILGQDLVKVVRRIAISMSPLPLYEGAGPGKGYHWTGFP